MGGAGDRGRQLDQLHQSQLTPLSGNRRRSTEMPCVLHAQAINLGLTGMACAREFTYQQLEWAREQYCREQVLTAASAGPEGERRGAHSAQSPHVGRRGQLRLIGARAAQAEEQPGRLRG